MHLPLCLLVPPHSSHDSRRLTDPHPRSLTLAETRRFQRRPSAHTPHAYLSPLQQHAQRTPLRNRDASAGRTSFGGRAVLPPPALPLCGHDSFDFLHSRSMSTRMKVALTPH